MEWGECPMFSMRLLRRFFADAVVLAVLAVALVQGLFELGAILRLAEARLVGNAFAPTRTNIVLHAPHYTLSNLALYTCISADPFWRLVFSAAVARPLSRAKAGIV